MCLFFLIYRPAEDTPLFTESMKKMNIETEDRPKKYMEQYLQKKEANGKVSHLLWKLSNSLVCVNLD